MQKNCKEYKKSIPNTQLKFKRKTKNKHMFHAQNTRMKFLNKISDWKYLASQDNTKDENTIVAQNR